MDLEKIMEGISKELSTAIKTMAKSKSPEEKLKYSEIVKNLSDSLGVFIDLMAAMAPYEEDDSIPF